MFQEDARLDLRTVFNHELFRHYFYVIPSHLSNGIFQKISVLEIGKKSAIKTFGKEYLLT